MHRTSVVAKHPLAFGLFKYCAGKINTNLPSGITGLRTLKARIAEFAPAVEFVKPSPAKVSAGSTALDRRELALTSAKNVDVSRILLPYEVLSMMAPLLPPASGALMKPIKRKETGPAPAEKAFLTLVLLTVARIRTVFPSIDQMANCVSAEKPATLTTDLMEATLANPSSPAGSLTVMSPPLSIELTGVKEIVMLPRSPAVSGCSVTLP
jgi:hypothetical protein